MISAENSSIGILLTELDAARRDYYPLQRPLEKPVVRGQECQKSDSFASLKSILDIARSKGYQILALKESGKNMPGWLDDYLDPSHDVYQRYTSQFLEAKNAQKMQLKWQLQQRKISTLLVSGYLSYRGGITNVQSAMEILGSHVRNLFTHPSIIFRDHRTYGEKSDIETLQKKRLPLFEMESEEFLELLKDPKRLHASSR